MIVHTCQKVEAMFSCVNCGTEVSRLYKKFPSGLLKPEVCSSCGLVVDKYVEYDTTLVLIDLVLLKSSVYRHLLLNTSHTKIFLRLLVLVILSSAYCLFIEQISLSPETESFHDLEWSFYLTCISYVKNFTLFTVLLTSSFVLVNQLKPQPGFSLRLLSEALIVGQCGQFLKLIAVIWGQSNNAVYMALLTGYVIVSTIQGCRVVTRQSRWLTTLLVLLAYLATTPSKLN